MKTRNAKFLVRQFNTNIEILDEEYQQLANELKDISHNDVNQTKELLDRAILNRKNHAYYMNYINEVLKLEERLK